MQTRKIDLKIICFNFFQLRKAIKMLQFHCTIKNTYIILKLFFQYEKYYAPVQIRDPRSRLSTLWAKTEAADLIVPRFKVCCFINTLSMSTFKKTLVACILVTCVLYIYILLDVLSK